MADYSKFRSSVKASNNDIINIVSKAYPGFSKIQCSMINNPERYGVRLTKEAEQLLIEEFNSGKGLDTKAKRSDPVKRTKTNRMSVRLDKETYDAVASEMRRSGAKSTQEFLERVLKNVGKEGGR
jgi:hypothetical protein